MSGEHIHDTLEKESLLAILSETENLTNVGGWEWDIAKDKWTFSDNWLRIHGCSKRHLETSELLIIAHPDDRYRIQKAFDAIISEGAKYEIEHRIIRQDTGEERYIMAHGKGVFDRDGKVVKIYGAAQDITKAKETEKALRESEDKFKYVFDNSVIGKSLTSLSGEMHTNKAFYKMLGYSKEEFEGLKWQEITHPEDIELSQNKVDTLIYGEKESTRFSKRYLHKNGKTVWTDISVLIRRDKDNKPLYFISSINNITNSIKAEEKLKERNIELQLSQKIANIGGWSLDPEVGVPEWSEEIYRIYERDPKIGPHPLADYKKIYKGKWWKIFNTAIKGATEEGKPYDIELKLELPSGNIKWVHAICEPEKEVGPKGRKLRGTIQDITERKKASEALQQSEERQRQIIEDSGAGYFLIDLDGRYQSVNSAWLRMHKYETDEEIIGQHFSLTQVEGELPEAQKKVEEMLSGKSTLDGEFSRRCKDGSIGWHTFTAKSVKENKKVIGLEGFLIDITDRKVAEEAQRESEEMMRNSQSVAHICSYSTDLNADAIEESAWVCSPEFYKIFGIDKTYPHTIEGWANFIHPDYRDEVFDYHESVVKEKKMFSREYKIIRINDGEERWVHGTGKLEFDEKGNPVRMHGAIQDITERKQANEALRKSEARHSKMVANIGDVITIIDQDNINRYKSPNIEKLFGWKPEDVIGESTWDLIHPDDIESTQKFFEKILSEPEAVGTMECRYRCKGDDYRWIEFTGANFLHDSDINGLLGNYRDITERRAFESQVRQTQKMESIGNLAGGIAHDFNNLLTPIIGMSELMLEDLEPDSLAYENAQGIYRAGNRAKNLVSQILSFSRQFEHEMIPVKFQKILKEALKLCRSTIPTNIEIEQKIQQDCGSIWANTTNLHQIAMNLITNAYHAVQDKNGKISVELKEIILEKNDLSTLSVSPGKYAVLSVSDNGSGIKEEIKSKIFEPYFTTKEKGKGTGLGLAVVYGIAKEFGGDIQVYSEVGSGTIFNIYLPLMKKNAAVEARNLKSEIQTGNEHILLVDDEPSITHIVQLMLERLGYTVTTRESSIEALEAFKENPEKFDIIISDMSMPNMTGDQLAHEIRQTRPEIPIIIFTGFSDRINKENAEAIGVNGFLMKPIEKSEMAKMVRKVLDDSKNQ